MTYSESILPEFEHEMASTRRVIERVPAEKYGWKAHPKSNTMGWNVGHLVEIAGWVAGTMANDAWDVNPTGDTPFKTHVFATREEALQVFDQNVAEAKQALTDVDESRLGVMWSLLSTGRVILSMPRRDVIRTFILNHTIHHRAILTVYLRLNDIPVPGMYGPTGDE